MELKIFQYFGEAKVQLKLKDNIFHLFENIKYQFEFFSRNEIIDNKIFIDNSSISSDDYETVENYYLKTKPGFFFLNTFGYSQIKIDGNQFMVQVDATKLTAQEAEKILSYLYEKNKSALNHFFVKKNNNEDEINSKNFKAIYNFIENFEQLFSKFKTMPHFKLEKKEIMVDYPSSQIDDTTVFWLSQNLHLVQFDRSFEKLPQAILINNKYGIIEKVAINANVKNYNIYENQIILGGLCYIKNLIDKIEFFIHQINDTNTNFNNFEYANYRSITKIFFKDSCSQIYELKNRVYLLLNKYKKIFKNINPRIELPKANLTVNKIKHYQSAFYSILKIHQTKINLGNENLTFGISSLDKLYEYYNYYKLIDFAKSFFAEKGFIFKENKNPPFCKEKFSIISEKTDLAINIYYEPKITLEANCIKLIKIGNIKTQETYSAQPDFVIEIVRDNIYRYAILDAKYRRTKSVINDEIKETTYKYILSLGVEGKFYQKPDFLYLIYPDTYEEQTTWQQNFNDDYFPIIGAITSKPEYEKDLEEIFAKIMNKWEVNKVLYIL